MADKKKGGGPEKKKARKKPHELYEVAGEDIKKKNKSCPKCGSGTYMANHSNRNTCGKCGFMEKK